MTKIPVSVTGKLLRVNLTSKNIKEENIPFHLYKDYLGGRGAGAYYLAKELDRGIDPLGEDNKLIFFTGPVIGTIAPGSNKVSVTFKSPLTNTYSMSLCGGFWGPELKFAGYDGLIVEGKSAEPVYLWIDNGEVSIRTADHLWGKLIPKTSDEIRKELGNDDTVRVACIGPAGEKLNKMACITADRHREFGRGGAGAVMGSKNLKAIAIRGTGEIEISQKGKMASLVKNLYQEFKIHPKAKARTRYGTVEMLDGINKLGFWSTRNFSQGYFEGGDKLVGHKMRDEIVVGDASCYSCPIGCGKNTKVFYKGSKVHIEGPEFETVGLLGANCGVNDWESILKATEICDYYGMDTMAIGATVSFAMECFENGIINLSDTDNLELRFGNGDELVSLVDKIAKRDGLGDLLAEGVKTASEKLGAQKYAMHSKGLPLATYDPRGCKGMALTYATSSKGAHHMISPTMGAEIPGDRFAEEDKAGLVKDTQIEMALVDSLGLCSTMRFVLDVGRQQQLLEHASGMELSKEEILKIGERILNLERLFNIQEGFDRKDDTLPNRFLKESFKEGLSAGHTIDLKKMLDEYYQVMGWDSNGIPSESKLIELDISEITNLKE
ncbi:MAG: hypothetical protein APF76_09590 [Desulfitibacter sp. BRH_c19]|nr:MAG: hypothetical protein APF76_09590 [Desulfitibacter sp. BRH_c19]